MAEPRPLIVVADDDPIDREALRGALLDLEPMPEILEASTIESLIYLVHQREVDLLTLDVSFSGSDRSTREGLEALEVLVQQHPRIPVLLVSGNLNIRLAGEAGHHAQVQGVLDKGQADLWTELPEKARQAIAWGREQRRAADALFEKGILSLERGNPLEAARWFIEAHDTGDLSLVHKARLGDLLGQLLVVLEPHHDLRVRAFWTLLKNALNSQDEMALVYLGRRLAREVPDQAIRAHEYLLEAASIGNRIYGVIDERLELARLSMARGDLGRVIAECNAIQDRLADVVESYTLQIEALKRTGRREEAIHACFQLAEIQLTCGNLDIVQAALEEIGLLDLEGAHTGRREKMEDHLAWLRARMADDQAPAPYPYLTICAKESCRHLAKASQALYRIEPEVGSGCSLCGRAIAGRLESLAGKGIAVIGGRFPEQYRQALLDMGAGTVLTVSDPDRVSEAITRADGVLLVTGRATESCVIRARRELARTSRPTGEVKFYGVLEVTRGVLYDLAPRMVGVESNGVG